MRLLSKSEINAQKASDRAREIAEGKKLASRVDVLRETAAEEETNLLKFRHTTLASIQKDIDSKIKEREALDAELEVKHLERVELEKPLTAAWENITAEQNKLDLLKRRLATQDISLGVRQETLAEKERETDALHNQAESLKRIASQELIHAQRAREEAQRTAFETVEHANALKDEADIIRKDAGRREEAVAMRERDVTNRQKNVDAYEERLFKKEQELKGDWFNLQESKKYNDRKR